MPGYKFQGVNPRKNLVVRTPCFSASYPQGVRVPPVKNHCTSGTRTTGWESWVNPIENLCSRGQGLTGEQSHFQVFQVIKRHNR